MPRGNFTYFTYLLTIDAWGTWLSAPLPSHRFLSLTMALHILSCETRHVNPNGRTARDLRIRTLGPAHVASSGLRGNKKLVLRELCAGRRWPSQDFGVLKDQVLSEYAKAVPPNDLLWFTDSDVLFNLDATTPSKVQRRFEAARNGAHVVFMAEPWCFAPTTVMSACRGGGRRLVPRTACSDSLLAQYERMPRWEPSRLWQCPRFLNGGAYIGFASEVAKVAELLGKAASRKRAERDQAALLFKECRPRAGEGYNEQCVATEILLRSNASVTIDTHEAIFASGGTAIQAFATARPYKTVNSTHCSACGRQRCRCSLLNDWRMPAGRGKLLRNNAYIDKCMIHRGGPLVVHFNGVSKGIMKQQAILSWLNMTFP